jgi:hypothetical protein
MVVSRYIAQPEKKELLLQLLQWMPSQGYVVDSSSHFVLLLAYYLCPHRFIKVIYIIENDNFVGC